MQQMPSLLSLLVTTPPSADQPRQTVCVGARERREEKEGLRDGEGEAEEEWEEGREREEARKGKGKRHS